MMALLLLHPASIAYLRWVGALLLSGWGVGSDPLAIGDSVRGYLPPWRDRLDIIYGRNRNMVPVGAVFRVVFS